MNANHPSRPHWQLALILTAGMLMLAWLWLIPQTSIAAPAPLPQQDTATVTATPTATRTPEIDFLPLIFRNDIPTGTVPTPTVTGTITPNPTIVVSVNPNEAKVNQKMVFTVKITNPGLGPAYDATLNDSFSTDVTVTNGSTTKGLLNRQANSLNVALGDILPNTTVTVTIEININNAKQTTQNLNNTVYLFYNTNQTRSGSVGYRIVGTGLPGTGQTPLENQPVAVDWSLLFLCGALALASVFVIWYGFWIREEQPQASGRYWAIGGVIAVAGLIAGVAGSGWFSRTNETRPQVAYAPTHVVESLAGYAIAPIFPTEDATRYELIYPTEISELPDYPVPSPTAISETEAGQIVDTSSVVRLGIPALNLDTIVKYVPFNGETWMIAGLKQEIAWLGDTSWPGLGGNTVLAGHVTVAGMGNGPFRYLDQLAVGDSIQVYTEENLYTYKVREQIVVEEGDLWVTQPTDNPQLTLITCTDWSDEFRLYVKRLIIFADLKDTTSLQVGKISP